jgi:outer membrane immunogenic protein
VTLASGADRTNGVVGGCGCFWMQGGRAEANASFGQHLSVVAEVAGEQTASIDSAHQSLSFVTYLFGPRYSLRNRTRAVPFAQFLLGGVHGFDALFPSVSSSAAVPDALAFAPGGGINVNLSRRFALRAVQADYLQTCLPNGAANRQNHLRLSAGIVFRFRGRGQ